LVSERTGSKGSMSEGNVNKTQTSRGGGKPQKVQEKEDGR